MKHSKPYTTCWPSFLAASVTITTHWWSICTHNSRSSCCSTIICSDEWSLLSLVHQLLQLFRAHNLFPPPLRITVSGVWLQKHVQYFPRLLSITLPEGQPSAREEETRIKSWMRGSQPANCPQLTLLLLMHFLSQIWPACCFLPSNVLCFHNTLWSVKKLPENCFFSLHIPWNQVFFSCYFC